MIMTDQQIRSCSTSELQRWIENVAKALETPARAKKAQELLPLLQAELASRPTPERKSTAKRASSKTIASLPSYPADYLQQAAAIGAVCSWFGDEGAYSQKIRDHEFSADEFQRWLVLWMLVRRIPKKHGTDAFLRMQNFLNHVARPIFLAASTQSLDARCSDVSALASRALSEGITQNRETSLISKFAFSCLPTIFIPYDRTVRDALRGPLGFRFEDHDYVAYTRAFCASADHFGAPPAPDVFTVGGKIMDAELFALRYLDKRLMLLGGFNPLAFEKAALALDHAATMAQSLRRSRDGREQPAET